MRLRKEERKNAFTLTEVLIAVAIVGIIAGLVLPKLIENYQTKTMDSAFQREVQTIEDSINGLAVSENKADFFSTMMYKDTAPESYDDSSGMYIKKYLKISKMCDNPNDCFAPTYYQYEAGKSRSEYKPDYKGACAILKNGMSICMIPQIGAANITGIIDLNGKKGPNVYNKDLRTFSIAAKTRVGLNQDTEGVRKLDWDNIKCEEDEPEPEIPPAPPTPTDPCDVDKNSLACCQKRSITNSYDPCCSYNEIKQDNQVCKKYIKMQFHCDSVGKGKFTLIANSYGMSTSGFDFTLKHARGTSTFLPNQTAKVNPIYQFMNFKECCFRQNGRVLRCYTDREQCWWGELSYEKEY